MILDALYATINPIMTAYPMIGEYDAEVPFCTFEAEPVPIRTKDGIIGYMQRVTVYVIDNDMDNLVTNDALIQAALLALTGNVSSTIINSVAIDTESAIEFDKLTATYQKSTELIFDTNNK